MPIFVTGGTGLLGVNLIRLLVNRGESVRALARSPRKPLGLAEYNHDRVMFVRGDVTDAASVRAAMEGCDRVYHLAGWVQISPWGWEQARAVNVGGTRTVCETARELGVRRLVHTSSIAAIGAGTLDAPADETDEWNIRAERIPYYATKRESEAAVLESVRRGLDAVIVNPTYVVGPWDIKPSSGRMMLHTARGVLKFYPSRGGINYSDVRAVALGHVLAMEHGDSGERYILGGENLPFRDYVERVAKIAGVSPPRVRLPYAAMLPFAAAGSAAGRLFPKLLRDVNLAVLHSACLEHYVRSDKACAKLGYEAVPVDDAIRDALAWFKEHGYL